MRRSRQRQKLLAYKTLCDSRDCALKAVEMRSDNNPLFRCSDSVNFFWLLHLMLSRKATFEIRIELLQ